MVQRQVLSVIFLALVSVNVIQAGILPLGLFHHSLNGAGILPLGLFQHENLNLPNLISPISHVLNGFGFENIPLFQKLFTLRDYFANRGIMPSITSSAVDGIADPVVNGVLSPKDMPGGHHLLKNLFGRHLGNGIGSTVPATGVASSASSTAV